MSLPAGNAHALTAVTLMVRLGAVPGQIPAAAILPVGKSVGFDVTISVVVPPMAIKSVSVVVAAAIPRSGGTVVLSVPSIVGDMTAGSEVTVKSGVTEAS